jgi:hypothetical protein
MKIAHISATKRSNGDMTGVPKFAVYLQKAIGCDILIHGEKNLNDYNIVIGDGYNVPSPMHVGQKVISMVHGTYARWMHNVGEADWVKGEIVRQNYTWTNPNIHVVACSYADKKYVKQYHNRDVDTVILHGIDTNLFRPYFFNPFLQTDSPIKKLLVMHTATNYCKDAHGKLGLIGDKLKERGFRFEAMDCWDGKEHERFKEADIYIHPSLHEGNSYSCLESMSCNVPVVVSRTGLFEDTNFGGYNIGEILDINASAEEYVQAVEKVASNLSSYNPRKWVLDNATFEIFSKNWNDYLRSL